MAAYEKKHSSKRKYIIYYTSGVPCRWKITMNANRFLTLYWWILSALSSKRVSQHLQLVENFSSQNPCYHLVQRSSCNASHYPHPLHSQSIEWGATSPSHLLKRLPWHHHWNPVKLLAVSEHSSWRKIQLSVEENPLFTTLTTIDDLSPSTIALRCFATPTPLKYFASASASAAFTWSLLWTKTRKQRIINVNKKMPSAIAARTTMWLEAGTVNCELQRHGGSAGNAQPASCPPCAHAVSGRRGASRRRGDAASCRHRRRPKDGETYIFCPSAFSATANLRRFAELTAGFVWGALVGISCWRKCVFQLTFIHGLLHLLCRVDVGNEGLKDLWVW